MSNLDLHTDNLRVWSTWHLGHAFASRDVWERYVAEFVRWSGKRAG